MNNHLPLSQISHRDAYQLRKEAHQVLVHLLGPAVQHPHSIQFLRLCDKFSYFGSLCLKQPHHLGPSLTCAGYYLAVSLPFVQGKQFSVVHLVRKTIRVYQHALPSSFCLLLEDPNEGRYARSQSDQQIGWPHLFRQEVTLQQLPFPTASLAPKEIMAAESLMQASLSNVFLNQLDQQEYPGTFHASNRVFSCHHLVDMSQEVPVIELELKITHEVNDVSSIFADIVEVFLVTAPELNHLLLQHCGGSCPGQFTASRISKKEVIKRRTDIRIFSQELTQRYVLSLPFYSLPSLFSPMIQQKLYIFLSIMRKYLSHISFLGLSPKNLQSRPIRPPSFMTRQLLYTLHLKFNLFIQVAQRYMRGLLPLFLNSHCLLLKKGSDSIPPSIQINLPIPLRVHIVAQPYLSELLPTKHPQALSEFPCRHSEVIPI